MKNFYPEERRELIVEYVNQNQKASVNELAELYSTTPVTIRSDLRLLDSMGRIKRTHGGAVPILQIEQEIELDNRMNTEEKILIAKKAIQHIKNGETLCIDTGTTANLFATELSRSPLKNLTILSSDLTILKVLDNNPNFSLISIGGNVRGGYGFAFGSETLAQISKYRVDKYIMTTSAINVENGLSTPNQDTALLKRAYIDIANEVILLSDRSKFGKQSLCIFAKINEIDLIISDQLTEKICASLLENNIKVETIR